MGPSGLAQKWTREFLSSDAGFDNAWSEASGLTKVWYGMVWYGMVWYDIVFIVLLTIILSLQPADFAAWEKRFQESLKADIDFDVSTKLLYYSMVWYGFTCHIEYLSMIMCSSYCLSLFLLLVL